MKPKNQTKAELLELLRIERQRSHIFRIALIEIVEVKEPAPPTMLKFIAQQALDQANK